MNRPMQMIVCLTAALGAGSAFAQTHDDSTPTFTTEPHVYVSTTNGINLYYAAANGVPSLVSGSPFQTTQPMIGSNGSYLLTLDNSDHETIHSYAVSPDGAIGAEVSTINTQDYTGVNCGPPTDAVLDHSGANIYVLLDTTAACGAFQTYGIGQGTGILSFKGAAVNDKISTTNCCSMPAITPRDTFAYSSELTFYCDGCNFTWGEFKIESNGTMENWNAPITGPKGKSSNYKFMPVVMATDPDNHLALLGDWLDPNVGYNGGQGLASYTVNPSTGALTSTNTWKELPAPINKGANSMVMSPSGKILALYGQQGLQFFHFNGASPITDFAGLQTTVEIDQMAWDDNNHVYALSDAYAEYSRPFGQAELFVFTVTPTSIEEVPGSPFPIAGANGLVVVQ